MPETASKESKRNNIKKGRGAGRRWEMPQGEKESPLREYMLMQSLFAHGFSGERRGSDPAGELRNHSIINLCSSADHTWDFMVIKLQIKSGSFPSECKQLCSV